MIHCFFRMSIRWLDEPRHNILSVFISSSITNYPTNWMAALLNTIGWGVTTCEKRDAFWFVEIGIYLNGRSWYKSVWIRFLFYIKSGKISTHILYLNNFIFLFKYHIFFKSTWTAPPFVMRKCTIYHFLTIVFIVGLTHFIFSIIYYFLYKLIQTIRFKLCTLHKNYIKGKFGSLVPVFVCPPIQKRKVCINCITRINTYFKLSFSFIFSVFINLVHIIWLKLFFLNT